MGFLQRLFGRKTSELKIRNRDDLEQYLLILVYWPPIWKEVRAGKKVNREDIAMGGQIEALVTLGEATQYLNGEKERGQLSDSARFVVGGLRDIFHATESRTEMLSELEASVKGPHKVMLAMLLSLHGVTAGPKFSFKDTEGAKERMLGFRE